SNVCGRPVPTFGFRLSNPNSLNAWITRRRTPHRSGRSARSGTPLCTPSTPTESARVGGELGGATCAGAPGNTTGQSTSSGLIAYMAPTCSWRRSPSMTIVIEPLRTSQLLVGVTVLGHQRQWFELEDPHGDPLAVMTIRRLRRPRSD